MTGWLCPRCNTSNAPWQPSCAGCAETTGYVSDRTATFIRETLDRNVLRVVVVNYTEDEHKRIKYFIEHVEPRHLLTLIETWEKTTR